MSRTIILAASLPAPPERLYEMYLNPQTHAEITGQDVTISATPGTPFIAFGGMLSGAMLHVEPRRLIVQRWRSGNWPATAGDSVLVLSFVPEVDGGRIELVHVGVPEEDFAGVSQGWTRYYFEPWRALLERTSSPGN